MDKLVCRDYCYKFVTLLTQIWSLGVKQNPLHKLSNIVTSGAGSRGSLTFRQPQSTLGPAGQHL